MMVVLFYLWQLITHFINTSPYFFETKLHSYSYLFSRLGCQDFTWPICKPNPKNGASHSLFYPEEAIFHGHPRFATLTRNIRERRGEKVAINLPSKYLFQSPASLVHCVLHKTS